jgi:hypothetical protein
MQNAADDRAVLDKVMDITKEQSKVKSLRQRSVNTGAPCMPVCPQKAIYRREDGIVSSSGEVRRKQKLHFRLPYTEVIAIRISISLRSGLLAHLLDKDGRTEMC